MTRSPIRGNGFSYRRGPISQSDGSQSTAVQRSLAPRLSNSHAANNEPNPANNEPNPANSEPNTANSEPNGNMEEIAPVVRDIRVLHPSRRNGAKWFKHNTEVSTQVRKVIEGCFKGPWYSWKKVPHFYREAWFSTFQTKFEWDASIDNLVQANFENLAATRLKGMISLAKSNGEKPDWILSEYWRVMSEYWRTPKAKEKSEKARTSRLFNRDGLGAHSHRSGSRSYAKVKDVLEANNEDSSFMAVMKKTHQKSDGSYVDKRAQLIAERYDEYVRERLSQMDSTGEGLTADSLTQEEKNEIYVKVAGISKQGRVFGLGSLQSGAPMPLDGSSVSPPPEEVDALSRRVEELENELVKSREDKLLFQKRLEAMESFCFSTSS
ncbi:putative transposase-like protein [Cardamine amara subsp. amara]|uniref:Transposase-like protein n=1 Tax=Cardamine amara subsp. amara TaxID=228776 RepID=A0ABD1A141_CARAN